MKIALLGFLTPWIVYAYITLLHYLLPARKVIGYVEDEATGQKLRYRLNGLLVLIVCVLTWFALGYFDIIAYDWLYTVRWYSLAGAFTIGILYTLITVLPYESTGKPLAVDLFLGRPKNPQYANARIDAKMWLYLVGAVMLELHVLSFSGHHHLLYGAEASPGIFLSAIFLTYFICDYLTFERVHLYTYDIFAERVGFKLGWGCLVFYPYFYSISLWSSVDSPNPESSTALLIISAAIFFTGWCLARGANMQKFYFKTQPSKSFLGIKPEAISNGKHTLLANGFWGLSRHINYLGEVLMGCGIALAIGGTGGFWPWLYPLYYVALLFPRQMDDDKRCSEKYGDLWDEYTQKVKYRIIPFIY